MKAKLFLSITSSILAMFFSHTSFGNASPGSQAPDFKLPAHDGKEYALSDYAKKGQYVVLEWFNKDCPYVDKHYGSKNMQTLQDKYTSKDVVWFTVLSSAEGKQGYLDKDAATAVRNQLGQKSTAMLLDPEGDVGKLYGAKTTPHMYIINPEGKIVYNGAIDSDSSYRQSAIAGAENYVSENLDALLAGEPVKVAQTKPYGCSVKYKK